jgi:succinate dehydrogenase / fumarate reductase, cytochrome b subunit
MGVKAYFQSSIGGKTIVALTGLALSLFVLIHMAGNMLVFLGPGAINNYAASLKANAVVLWLARGGLAGTFLIHITFAILLTRRNRAARPIPYGHPATIQATFASRSMIYSGLLLLAFLFYHLAHFTLQWAHPEPHLQTANGMHDVFKMVISGFQSPLVAGTYIFAMLCLGLHLNHGIASTLQSLGIMRQRWRLAASRVGTAFALLVTCGNVSIPLAVQLNIISQVEGE